MTLFEILSLGAVGMGGGWALLQIHFNLRAKLEETQAEATKEAIQRLDGVVTKIAEQMITMDKSFTSKIETMVVKVESLSQELATHSSEVRQARIHIDKAYRKFTDDLEKFYASQVREIAHDVFRVETKKDQKK